MALVASRFRDKTPEGLLIPPNRLRNYTIQIFQQPTAKMAKFQELLQGLGHMKIEELGEGKQRLTLLSADLLTGFVDFYNDWIFKGEEKRTSIEERELKALRALTHYGHQVEPDGKGVVKVNLTEMQNHSLREIGFPFSTDDVNGLAEKKVTSEKMSGEGGLFLQFNLQEIEMLFNYWEIIWATRKVAARD